MSEKTKVFQFSVKPSLVDRVKAEGDGKFAAGLFNILRDLDRLQGTVERHDEIESNKGVRKSEFKEDKRLPRNSGEHQATYNKRLAEYVANLPETRNAKIKLGVQNYVMSGYRYYKGFIDEDTTFDLPIFGKDHMPTGEYMEGVRIMAYTTREECAEWMEHGRKKYYEEQEARKAALLKPAQHEPAPTHTREQRPAPAPALTPEAAFVCGFPNGAPANVPDETIEQWNRDCAPGGQYHGHKPLRG